MTAFPPSKRLVILLPCLLTGGTEVATLETAVAMQSLGLQVEVIVYFDEVDADMLLAFESSGVLVSRLGLRRGPGVIAHLRLASALARALWHGSRPALVWLQYLTPTLLPLLVAKPFARRLVAAVHVSAEHFDIGARRRLRWLARRWCNRVVCVSETTAAGLFGGDVATSGRGCVTVIANAVDTDAARNAEPTRWRALAGWPQGARVVGYVGRFAEIKGPDLLIDAFAQLAQRRAKLRLVLVGAGAQEQALRDQAAQLGIADLVYFAGPRPRAQVFSALGGFDLAVVPSREEGFGLSAAEAMAAGVATVATRVGALPELMALGQAGVLVAPESPGALAEGMALLLDDPALCARIAAAGTRHVERHFGRAALLHSLGRLCASLGMTTLRRGNP
ncbi:MAG: glycosyltransferase family 4 protein [Xanthomonadales bacterium]|nr:glycosyltransferase family 4 protein [Xanthomonadales bacterium]